MPRAPREALWERVRDTYSETGSLRATAEEVCLSKSGVEYALRQMGVELLPRIRTGEESSSRKAILKDPESPSAKIRDKALMTELYIKKKMSTVDIGKMLGCKPNTVRTGLLQCGIKLRSRRESLKGKPRPNYQGAKHRDWKGGITAWRKRARIRLNPTFVRPVMERDGFRCQLCGGKKNLIVHHIRDFALIVKKVLEQLPEASVEEHIEAIVKEHSLEDGLTLCKECHDRHHKRGRG